MVWSLINPLLYLPITIHPPLIIAARKHYTVDVIIALYVTPMFYYASYYIFPDPNMDHNQKDSCIEMDIEIDSSDFYRSL